MTASLSDALPDSFKSARTYRQRPIAKVLNAHGVGTARGGG
jgi:hypothetical protein